MYWSFIAIAVGTVFTCTVVREYMELYCKIGYFGERVTSTATVLKKLPT